MITKGNHGICVNIITMGIFIRLLLNYSSDQAEFLSLSTEAFFRLLIMFQTTEKMVGLWLVILTSSASIALHESKNFLSDPDLKFVISQKRLTGEDSTEASSKS